MAAVGWIVNSFIKAISRTLCRVHAEELKRIPDQGPLILIGNHINALEVPLIFTHLLPRQVVGFAKAETWDNPLLRPLFNLWKAIPIHRGEIDRSALRLGLQVLQSGGILVVTPEGTRSGDGCLRRGHPGMVKIAQMSGAPIMPAAHYGIEKFYSNIRRLKRTDFYTNVGQPFYLKLPNQVGREERQRITDEIMYRLAALLPEAYRGVYSDLDAATTDYLLMVE